MRTPPPKSKKKKKLPSKPLSMIQFWQRNSLLSQLLFLWLWLRWACSTCRWHGKGSGNRTNGKASNSFGLCYVTGKTYPTNSFKGSSHGAQAPKWIGNWLSLSLKLLRQHSQPQGNNSIREAAGTFPPSSLPMVSTYLWPFHAARWLKGSAHSHLILWLSHVFIP